MCLGAVDECPDAAEVRRTLELLQHELRCMREQELPEDGTNATQATDDDAPTVVEHADEYLEREVAVRSVLAP